jgi:hypothetical protein
VGKLSEAQRIELRLAEQMRDWGFPVAVSYQPERIQGRSHHSKDLHTIFSVRCGAVQSMQQSLSVSFSSD